ncbi:BQ5605_C047g12339 [Microbotryum silenes-dioicae]|uniref:BQ5605_C047g12339 protein n=1 Tax=Microbotryum silenes-dioicae TaxID=796604 RepID=A0A2X0PPQ7_9BASI|nr:BQ5605_C047g12339 [Microbotryum silenes-dioicae]
MIFLCCSFICHSSHSLLGRTIRSSAVPTTPERQLLRPHFRRLLAPVGYYRGRALHGIDTEHNWKIVFRGTEAEFMRDEGEKDEEEPLEKATLIGTFSSAPCTSSDLAAYEFERVSSLVVVHTLGNDLTVDMIGKCNFVIMSYAALLDVKNAPSVHRPAVGVESGVNQGKRSGEQLGDGPALQVVEPPSQPRLADLLHSRWGRAVLDQAHAFRPRNTALHTVVKSLAAQRHWVLTPSPGKRRLGAVSDPAVLRLCLPLGEPREWARFREQGNTPHEITVEEISRVVVNSTTLHCMRGSPW